MTEFAKEFRLQMELVALIEISTQGVTKRQKLYYNILLYSKNVLQYIQYIASTKVIIERGLENLFKVLKA